MSVSTTATQAILQYSSPVAQACSLKAADMNRGIVVTGGSKTGGVVTIATRAPHGLAADARVYLEGTGAWDGWQTITYTSDSKHFSFASATSGSATTGNVGVLVDDLNPALFPGADQDSRPGNPNGGYSRGFDEGRRTPGSPAVVAGQGSLYHRIFVVGKRTAELAADGNRYTRALQANSRHHFTLTCDTQDFDREFTTQNLPLGDTHNEGLPVDRSRPGQYAYPTVQWANRAQSLIDPVTGVRSVRATGPQGTASTVQSFQAAIDSAAAWKTPSGPLNTGGTATFTGPCQSGNCALLLRADNLSLQAGATYTYGYGVGSSLDWVTVTISNASINGACADDGCKLAACLTVNGVTCTSAERDVSLTSSSATYTLGSALPIDVWQGSGPPGIASPDVSRATGTVNYKSFTRQLTWVSGSPFSVKWTPGSRIMVAGSEYQIASVQSELSLTLTAPGPVGDLFQDPYSANNFGVLIWKKTATAGSVTIGYTTFRYGSTSMPDWAAASVQNCSVAATSVGGISGYNCFMARELYWISADGTDVRDLGFVGLSYWNDGRFSTSWACGEGATFQQFDPLDGDTWYCMIPTYFTGAGIVKAHYQGPHTSNTPGLLLPDCGLNGGTQPCVTFTLMQTGADKIDIAGPAINPEYAASGYRAAYFQWGGISQDGDLLVYTREAGGQDTKGWQFIFTLGDRTPAGTNPNSIRPVASAASYRHPPQTWCSIHTSQVPEGGWTNFANNNLYYRGASGTYVMTLTSASLNASVGVPGGLNTCPSNPFGVTGQVCTDITVGGEPTLVTDGSFLQATQVGDVIALIPGSYVTESLRVLAKTDANHLTVQRGYQSSPTIYSSTTLTMECGAVNPIPVYMSAWNYRADPYGLNSGWSTVLVDQYNVDGHTGSGGGVWVQATGTWYRIGDVACPRETLSTYGVCYQIRRGTVATVINAPTMGLALAPPFNGALGVGNPNSVDTHPGPCLSTWCLDGRPMDGGPGDGAASMVGSNANPGIPVTGQLWKFTGGASSLRPKILATMAYVGRSALVDVSGPSSVIPTDATGSYQYCVALKSGECRSGSTAGDVYVNAPFVSTPYCAYPGIANQGDDTNAICIGPLGAYTGNLVQFGNTQQDATGAVIRRLGPAFSRWNQQGVFWNMSMTTTGQIGMSQVRWLDGVRHEDILTVLPSYPAIDSISRNTFVPIRLDIHALPTSGGGNSVVVEFGYAENGGADSFFCTSRQETCVAASSAVDPASPFFFAQAETYSGVPCASGCTVTIPALSQRVLYYRWKQLDASGAVVAVSDTRAIVTP
jgi:hypothetical protein